jgi:hypothetical protein
MQNFKEFFHIKAKNLRKNYTRLDNVGKHCILHYRIENFDGKKGGKVQSREVERRRIFFRKIIFIAILIQNGTVLYHILF